MERPVDAANLAFNKGQYHQALKQCRADITRYTIWHKGHTEPMVRAGVDEFKLLLEIDIKALAGMVDFLFWCYVKTGIPKEFPTTLERLRRNISDDRWQRKIIYFNALYALWPDWNEEHGRRELRKLGAAKDETDVETLQLYLDLFGDQLSFSERQGLIDQIVKLSETPVDQLHYRSLRATESLMIGDNAQAIAELTDAIGDFRVSSKGELKSYQKYRFALSLELFGALKSDATVLNEAIELYNAILEEEDFNASGKALICKSIGDTLRHQSKWEAAAKAYEKAVDLQSSPICQVFLSECWFHLGKRERAKTAINLIDPQSLSKGEDVDYALTFAAISIATGESEMLNRAEGLLRLLDVKAPYFRERRDAMLLAILETKTSGRSNSLLERAKAILRHVAKSAMRYVVLQPNIMGIGLDVGKMVDDWTNGTRKHSSSEGRRHVIRKRR